MELTAERLKYVATQANTEKSKELNHQTNIWIKDYFMNILLNMAKTGAFRWVGHIIRNPANNVMKFESYDAPSTGLNIDLIEQKLKEFGFKVNRTSDSYNFVVNWD